MVTGMAQGRRGMVDVYMSTSVRSEITLAGTSAVYRLGDLPGNKKSYFDRPSPRKPMVATSKRPWKASRKKEGTSARVTEPARNALHFEEHAPVGVQKMCQGGKTRTQFQAYHPGEWMNNIRIDNVLLAFTDMDMMYPTSYDLVIADMKRLVEVDTRDQ